MSEVGDLDGELNKLLMEAHLAHTIERLQTVLAAKGELFDSPLETLEGADNFGTEQALALAAQSLTAYFNGQELIELASRKLESNKVSQLVGALDTEESSETVDDGVKASLQRRYLVEGYSPAWARAIGQVFDGKGLLEHEIELLASQQPEKSTLQVRVERCAEKINAMFAFLRERGLSQFSRDHIALLVALGLVLPPRAQGLPPASYLPKPHQLLENFELTTEPWISLVTHFFGDADSTPPTS